MIANVLFLLVVVGAILTGCTHKIKTQNDMAGIATRVPSPSATLEDIPARAELRAEPVQAVPVEPVQAIPAEPVQAEPVQTIKKEPAVSSAQALRATLLPINITPLTAYTASSSTMTSNYRNCYTRIVITSEMANGLKSSRDGAEEILPYTTRGAFRRFFWGYKRDINLTAKIKIGEYESTTPLVTLSHQSNSDGELWSRSISHKRLDFPLFLVKEDGGASVPDIRIKLAGSKDYTSNMAGIALQVAVSAIQQVAPEASVLTRLNEQSTKDTARAIDGAIGKLFGSGISEEHVSDCDFRHWDSKRGVQVQFNLPKNDDSWDSELHKVGKWMISFDDPRPSIFSNWRICAEDSGGQCRNSREATLKEVHNEITAGQVLNYTLIKNGNGLGTIRAFILQQNWYVSAQTAFKGVAAEDKKIAEILCRNIHNEITGLGLNGDDANIVIWAVAKGLPQASSMDSGALSAETCTSAITKIENHRNPSAPAAPHQPKQ